VFLKKKSGQKCQKWSFLMKKQGPAKIIPPSYKRFRILKRDLGEPIRNFEKTRFLTKMHEKTHFYTLFHGLTDLCRHRTRKNHQKYVFFAIFDVFLTIFDTFHWFFHDFQKPSGAQTVMQKGSSKKHQKSLKMTKNGVFVFFVHVRVFHNARRSPKCAKVCKIVQNVSKTAF